MDVQDKTAIFIKAARIEKLRSSQPIVIAGKEIIPMCCLSR
jgi:hypothetical protein